MAETIQDLALRAKSGDAVALDELLTKGRWWIKSICLQKGYYLQAGGDIEDLVQEGLIGLHKALTLWDPAQISWYSFGQVIVTRYLITAVKAANRLKHQVLNTAMSLDAPAYSENSKGEGGYDRLEVMELPDVSGYGRDPADLVAAASDDDASDLANALLGSLTPYERTVFSEVILKGRTYAIAASRLGIGKKSLDNALQRAKRKIISLSENPTEQTGLSDEAVDILRRVARLAAQPKEALTEAQIREALPVENMRPGVMGRYQAHVGTYILPPARLLTMIPDIRDFAVGAKGPILEAYLAGNTPAEIAGITGRTRTSVEHHLRRTVQCAAKAKGITMESDGTPELTPLQRRLDQLWRKGMPIKEIYAALDSVATRKQVDQALASLRQRVYDRPRFVRVESELQTKRVPLVAPSRIPYLLGKAKPLLPEEYVMTLRLYMMGYSQQDIAQRRGVADNCIGKNDLPVIRRRLRDVKGFEFLHDRHAVERQNRLLWLESLGWTEETALEEVPTQHREVIALWLQGCSEKEISDKVCVPATAIQGRLGHCRMILRRKPEAQKRDGRHGAGTEAVRARKAASRAREYAEDLRRLRAHGHLLDDDRRRWLEMFFGGLSTTDMAEASGLEANDTTRGRMWARMKNARVRLEEIERQVISKEVAS